MTQLAEFTWILAAAIGVGLAAYALWLARWTGKSTLLRCPETGAVTLVDVRPIGSDGHAPRLDVSRCALWTETRECGRGCLARYGETGPGVWTDVRALRPFEEP
jgi:hypothetical protein